MFLDGWVSKLEDSTTEDVVKIRVGNKYDKQAKFRQVSKHEGESLAFRMHAGFYETSAFTGYNVTSAINELLNVILKIVYDKSMSIDRRVTLKNTILTASKHSESFKSIHASKKKDCNC